MCANYCIAWAIRCSARGGDWPVPMPGSRIVGTGTPIPTLKKARRKNWALIFTDEASFRQDTTLHATWSRVGRAPESWVTGDRKTVKILGAIELLRTRFHYRQDSVFNASTYLAFLEPRTARSTLSPPGCNPHPGQCLLS